MAQPSNQDNKIKVDVLSDQFVDLTNININLSEGIGWHTTIMSIFHDGIIDDSNFPTKPGIYNLTINYADSLFYTETLLYRIDPKFEKLSFKFYKEGDRIFCKINSKAVPELRKEIVMNQLTSEMKGND